MWVILSARPCCLIAATESPPPTTTGRRARRGRRGSGRSPACRARSVGISNTPSGPFQRTVFASAERLLDQLEALLADVDDVPARRELLGRDGLVLGAAGDLLGDHDVGRQQDLHALAPRPRRGSRRASSTRSCSARLLPTDLPWASRNVLAMPAADDQEVDLVDEVLEHPDLVADLGPADDRRERALGVARASCRGWRSPSPSAARRRPAGASRCPTVEAWARWAVPKASLT